MTYAKGRGVRLDVASTYGSAKTVTEVTEANPGVATSAAHGLLTKTFGYFSVATGMPQLEGQACRLGTVATNTFGLEDINTTDFGDFTAGAFIPVTAWLTVSNATEYNKGGGDANPLHVSVLSDDIQQQEQGQLNPETISISARMETISNAAMAVIKAAARAQGYCVFRLTLKDGNVRFFRGQPSLWTEQLAVGQPGTAGFSITVKGTVCEGAA